MVRAYCRHLTPEPSEPDLETEPFRILLTLALIIFSVALAALFRLAQKAPRRRLRRSAPSSSSALTRRPRFSAPVLDWAGVVSVAYGVNVATKVSRSCSSSNWQPSRFRYVLTGPEGLPRHVHDLTVGAAYLIASAGFMHARGVNLTSIVATSAGGHRGASGSRLQPHWERCRGKRAADRRFPFTREIGFELESKVQAGKAGPVAAHRDRDERLGPR